MPLGPVWQLEERVDWLEISRGGMAIKMGGVMFADEEATEAWVRALGEENPLHFE